MRPRMVQTLVTGRRNIDIASALVEQIRIEAEISARPGQHDRLMEIADQVEAILAENERLREAADEFRRFWAALEEDQS